MGSSPPAEDQFGQVLAYIEGFCHSPCCEFHGIGSSKNKQEKRIPKCEEDRPPASLHLRLPPSCRARETHHLCVPAKLTSSLCLQVPWHRAEQEQAGEAHPQMGGGPGRQEGRRL